MDSNSDTEHTPVKSNAVVKYSANQSPATFAQLQCNTDLNLPPSNWLSNSGSTYGLQHVFSNSTGFSSFRLAHMFPDCVGEVDVVSDAENIKNLLKLPYSHGQVSMMVHRVENTLLIDDFDIYKHLLRTAEKEWEWLRKFFLEHVRKSLTEKDRNLYLQNKSRSALRQKSLVSKFLYHSLVLKGSENETGIGQNEEPQNLHVSGPVLPDPNIEEELPDPTFNHKYNRNVVWTFEDIQMLIGTDIPIFGGSTHPCISLRLRDMSSPINVLTGIDYWLDNLMSNVPEVVMCYHLNGIVQKYELIKTEDLPYLENSKFSPTVIRDIAQNILSFLKSNATKAGHTYWLFKGKDDDVVKLYDLTSLCEEGEDKDQNPFTIPVAMLLYRVARNMKHSNGYKQSGTIRMLLKHCTQLLSKEKYPQIVTSSHYMISDLYVPARTDPAHPGLEQMETDDVESCYDDDETIEETCKQLRLSDKGSNNNFVYKPPPPIAGSLEERCHQALNHIVQGLDCLQYFPLQDENTEELKRNVEKQKKREEEETPKMARPNQPIPMPYPKTETECTKKKKSKRKKKNETNNNISPTALLLKQNAEPIPTWQEPDKNDNASWNAHLKTLLYEKASLVYAILAEQDYVHNNFGTALRDLNMLVLCQELLLVLRYSSRAVQESAILGRGGDSCFMIVKNWSKVDDYREQMSQYTEMCNKIIEEIQKEKPTESTKWTDVIPQEIESIEQMLLHSHTCYEKSLAVDPNQDLKHLYRRLGNIQNELGVFYMNKTHKNNNIEEIELYLSKAQTNLQNGLKSFEMIKDEPNLALLHSNMGRLMRMCGYYQQEIGIFKKKGQGKYYYQKALDHYQDALQALGNKETSPEIWEAITWELSSHLFQRAISLQDYNTAAQDESRVEREIVETLQKALQYCDTETDMSRQTIFQYRVASIHQRLASLYHNSFRGMALNNPRRKNILQLSKIHYDKACKLFRTLEEHTDLLKATLERVALSELLAKNASAPGKVKQLQYCLHLLVGVLPSISSLIKTEKENRQAVTEGKDEKADSNETLQTYVLTIEKQLQYSLKMLAKLCLNKACNKECDNSEKISDLYKSLYSATLKINSKGDCNTKNRTSSQYECQSGTIKNSVRSSPDVEHLHLITASSSRPSLLEQRMLRHKVCNFLPGCFVRTQTLHLYIEP